MAVKRFYETFHPEHYDLFIDVNRGKKLISGTSTITGEAQDDTIFINQKYMTISAVRADGEDVTFEVSDKDEAIKINLGRTGKTTIAIDYTAPLTDTMMGIYPSYYELDGEKSKSLVRNLKLHLLDKHFLQLMNLKQRLLSLYLLNGMKNLAKLHLLTCQKLKWLMVSTILKRLFACQLIL